MRWSDVYISGSATVLGQKEDTAAAVAAGRYDPAFRDAHGYESVCVGDGEMPLDMAVRAARSALSRSDVAPDEIKLVIHASCGPQGPDRVFPASYIQGMAIGRPACALEVKQACNGGMAALELGAAYVTAAGDGASALVTTSDNDSFSLPDVNRYAEDLGAVPGDAATALVLSRRGGVARLSSTAIAGDGRFVDLDYALTEGLEARSRTAMLTEIQRRVAPMVHAVSRLHRECIATALADADVDSSQIARWVFSNEGRHMVDWDLWNAFGIDESKTSWDWGRTVGHLAAGGQAAGLTHLLEARAVRAGDRIALCGGGAGFNVSCAVVEIVADPEWPSSEAA